VDSSDGVTGVAGPCRPAKQALTCPDPRPARPPAGCWAGGSPRWRRPIRY